MLVKRAELLAAKAAATTVVVGLVVGVSASPVLALPKPRDEQWPFGAWAVDTEIWPITTGAGVKVAVIDTGVEARLPDLRGVVLPGKTFIPLETDDGRKDLDDKLGGHGTGMAALIASQGRGTGLAGVAPDARILPLIDGETSRANAEAIRYAADHGARVVNMSFGSAKLDGCPAVLQQAVAYAISRDVVLVGASGNDAHLRKVSETPGNCAGVLTVGAVGGDKKVWRQSQRGDHVMAVAPGVQIATINRSGRFISGDGTSAAAALTSGAVALIRAKYPKMPGRQVVQRLLGTALDIGPRGWDERSGFGIVRPHDALTREVPANFPNPTYERLDRWQAQQQAAKQPAPTPSAQRPVAERQQKDQNSILLSLLVAATLGVLVLVLLVGGLLVVRAKRPRA